MHPLHDYIAKHLADKVKDRAVVVWYDKRNEFEPFLGELEAATDDGGVHTQELFPDLVKVRIDAGEAWLARYEGSYLEVRAAVEPLVMGDSPDNVVIYVGGMEHDKRGSVLMELAKAGTTWEPQLRNLARNVLLQKYTLGVVDDLLSDERKVTYEELAHMASGSAGTEPPSILKTVFHDVTGNDAVLAAWIVSDGRDGEISDKAATRELVKLIRSRIGLDLPEGEPLAKVRAITLRFVLANEFRSDLSCAPPASLDGIPVAEKGDIATVRDLARRLRTSFADTYEALADRVEGELSLRGAKLPPGALGAIDTFRFEERALLHHCGNLVANKNFDEALAIVAERENSFWLDRDVARRAQWEACRRMAELGRIATQVRAAVSKANGDASAWVAAYTSQDGWYRLDQAQRRLEAWLTTLDEEAEERPLGVVRRAYEDACAMMADGFTKAIVAAGWTVTGALHQTRVFSEVVSARPKPVAYFLVDAMRFEMGIELAERLPKTSEVSTRPAIGALPSITPVGMAALQPGASGSFSVVEQGGKLGARIDDVFLPDLPSRKKFAAARVPKLVDLGLDELLSLPASKILKKVEGAQVVVVRSQEIDHAGEAGFNFQAWPVMDTVIDNLARAIRKLAAAGVEHAVVTADHGHLIFPSDRDESMRIDAPGGSTVDLHRRCWIGRGGATPPGCVRVAASALGYASDLDFVFPVGCAVFKAGGDLAFHHGGPSLQEMIIPVVTVRTKVRDSLRPSAALVTVSGIPEVVTNRIFSATLTFGAKQMMLGAAGIVVRPMLMAEGKQVGAVGMAVDAELDRTTGCVTLEFSKPVTLAFVLSGESVASVRVVIQDPATDAELYRSPTDIPVRLGV